MRKVNCVRGNFYGESLLAISPNIFLLMGHGIHMVWTLNILPSLDEVEKNEYKTSSRENAAILIYYVGGIIGSIVGAGLISTVRKNCIYVSMN